MAIIDPPTFVNFLTIGINDDDDDDDDDDDKFMFDATISCKLQHKIKRSREKKRTTTQKRNGRKEGGGVKKMGIFLSSIYRLLKQKIQVQEGVKIHQK